MIPPGQANANYVANAVPYVQAVYQLAALNNCAVLDLWGLLTNYQYTQCYSSGNLVNMQGTVADNVHLSDNGIRFLTQALFAAITS